MVTRTTDTSNFHVLGGKRRAEPLMMEETVSFRVLLKKQGEQDFCRGDLVIWSFSIAQKRGRGCVWGVRSFSVDLYLWAKIYG